MAYWILEQFMAHFADEYVAKRLNLKKNIIFTFLYKIYPYIKYEFIWDLAKFLFMKKESRLALDKMEKVFANGKSIYKG